MIEPVCDLRVRYAPLRGIEVPVEHVPDMIDEFPALFVAAACADGPTTVRGAAELRVKESDRIAGMAAGLRALGIRVDETPDGATVFPGALQGGTIGATVTRIPIVFRRPHGRQPGSVLFVYAGKSG